MTSNAPESHADAESQPSVGQLVTSALDDVSTLVKHEIDLAKKELTFSVRNGGLGAALFVAAAFLLLLSVIMLSVAFAHLIHLSGLDLAWCFLIVCLAYGLVAALLAFIGWTRVRLVRPPNRAIEQAKETKSALMNRG